jgi:hypothetical protein
MKLAARMKQPCLLHEVVICFIQASARLNAGCQQVLQMMGLKAKLEDLRVRMCYQQGVQELLCSFGAVSHSRIFSSFAIH